MKVGKVNLSSLHSSSFRFDPSFHLSEGVVIRRAIDNAPLGNTCISDISERIFYGIRASRTYVSKKERAIPFLTGADIMLADLSNVKLASKKYTPAQDEMTLKEGWVLITRSGTVGQTAWSNKLHLGKYGSEDIIRLVPSNKTKGCIIYAFLASKYGQALLTQGSFGAVIKHIEPAFVGNIKMPNFDEEFELKVADLINTSASLRVEANKYLESATAIFNKKISVKDETTKCFKRNVRDLKKSWASYNNNQEVAEGLNQYSFNALKLGDITTKIFAPPMFKHIYLSKDNGYPFLTGGELVKQCMRYYRWLSPKGVKNISDYVVDNDTLLIYRHGSIDGGMNGQVFIVDDSLKGCCLSDLIIRVRFEDKDLAYWSFAFFKSNFGRRYLLSFPSGTAIPFMAVDRIEDAIIPAPDENYSEVVSTIKKYMEMTALSKQKEIEAITLVEKEIEKWNN